MPYNQDDPRSQLATMTAAPRPAGASFPAQYFELGSVGARRGHGRRQRDVVRPQPELRPRLLRGGGR